MSPAYLIVIFYSLFFFRLLTVVISAKNEKKLLLMGSIEYGKGISVFLVLAHFIYYGSCLTEGYNKGAFFQDTITVIGLVIYAFSIFILYYVIFAIRHVWTVKLIIAPKAYHQINDSWLFKTFKHPNYYLNIIPELIGVAMVFHAWFSLCIGICIYLIPLSKRILLEEKLMRQNFQNYK